MEPFSEILGLDNNEFASWRQVLQNRNQCVLLVEGEIDKKYVEHIHSLGLDGYMLPPGVEIVVDLHLKLTRDLHLILTHPERQIMA